MVVAIAQQIMEMVKAVFAYALESVKSMGVLQRQGDTHEIKSLRVQNVKLPKAPHEGRIPPISRRR